MTLLKGALVSFTPTFLTPAPNVTLFQYNPESLTHTWSQPDRAATEATSPGTEAGDPHAVPGMPGEQFGFTLLMDSNEDIADQVPGSAGLAIAGGVYARLSALEMLMYPINTGPTSTLLGQATAAATGGGAGSGTCQTNGTPPSSVVPVVLFVWGAYRIVPVRVTGLTIVEKLYDALLNPVHAEAQVALRVVTPSELAAAAAGNQVLAGLASDAYSYTLAAREANAVANLANLPVGAIARALAAIV